ncbi:MAG TPA: hypothetical protein ENJ37_00700 [Deltaproteobacteria bacterium]|nr:hypothetical protein [Deltaproteobacteria bacterium]
MNGRRWQALGMALAAAVVGLAVAVRLGHTTGGTFAGTEHGGADTTYPDRAYYPSTDNVTGVSRGQVDAFYNIYYKRGECNHCHEPHASVGGGLEPEPSSPPGPGNYLLFNNYNTKSSRVEFCGTCHSEQDPDANGVTFDTPYDFSFRGVTKYYDSAHYSRNIQWPGGQYGSTYPAKSASEAGACVNCHTPHGYPYSSDDPAVGSVPAGTPYPKQLVELTDINNRDPSTSPITGWPNVSGRDPDDAEDLCYTCHDGSPVQNKDLSMYNPYQKWGLPYYTSGATSIKESFQQTYHHPVKDSEQAGKTSYYHADASKPLDVHNKVECTTCHNPHLASGRWDDASPAWPSPTPVVLPGVTHGAYLDNVGAYDWPPPSWGLSYQPGELWGDDPEEKINALMNRFIGMGTGGWEFNVLRGIPYGGSPPWDQAPKYQPPFGGTADGQYQPDGDSLPDYITFCLDCHQHKLGSIMPIYWGAGFPPGVNPTQCDGMWPYACVTATGSEPHGFDAANQSPFLCCNPPGNACGDLTTDPTSPFYGEPRGRGYAVFSRPPYEMADRIAGINYVLACTDCHEPHGSPENGLLRKRINAYEGSTIHNVLCNACHYYYGGAMTYDGCGGGGLKGCATASCHLNTVLHRIDNNTGGGGAIIYTPTGCPKPKSLEVRFDMNWTAGSTNVTDNTGRLDGVVNNPFSTIPGDGYFHGDGSSLNYIEFLNDDSCLQSATEMTIEARIKPTGIPAGANNYIRRIFDRAGGANYQVSVWRNVTGAPWQPVFQPPDNVAVIAFWLKPVDAHGGKAWKPVKSDYNTCPVTNDHWYRVKVVWNSSKTGGIPGDIWIDDEGTDGLGSGENWSGYKNCTDSAQSQNPADRQLWEGDQIATADGDFVIGANINNRSNNLFNGLIDWISWKGVVDYGGVDDPPNPPQ